MHNKHAINELKVKTWQDKHQPAEPLVAGIDGRGVVAGAFFPLPELGVVAVPGPFDGVDFDGDTDANDGVPTIEWAVVVDNVGVTGLGSDFPLGVLLDVADGPVGLVGDVGDVALAACSFSIAIKA